MAQKYQVAVVRDDDIGAAVRRGIRLLGGIERFVSTDAHVVIKVNMFLRAAPQSARVTHPAVVLEVARLCREQGAHVTIVERVPHYDFIFRGHEQIEQFARLVALEEVEHRHVVLPGARSLLCQVPWPVLLDECDVFINIPGLRTHALTKFSNGMKNLMGLLPDQATSLVHHYGLDGSICDLNVYRPSDLIVTDAIYTLEGNFPSEGAPVSTGFITVADNVVAADFVGAELVGVNPQAVFHLQEAIERGLGPADLSEIQVLGDDLQGMQANVNIEPAPQDPEPYRGPSTLAADGACDSCRQALAGGLLAASHRLDPASMEDVTIIAGHQPLDFQVDGGRVLAYGNCAYRYRHLGHYEPGCPPLAYQVMRGLSELQPRTMRAAMPSSVWPHLPIEQVIAIAVGAGYQGIEIRASHLDCIISSDGLGRLAQVLQRDGLQVPMIDACSDLGSDTPAAADAVLRCIAYAKALGAPLIRVSTGGEDSATSTMTARRRAVSALREVCQLGETQGVGFVLAPGPGHLHDTVDSALRLIRQVALPNLGIDLDTPGLYACGEDVLRALKRSWPWLRIVHLPPLMTSGGESKHSRYLLAALADLNYGGYLVAALNESASAAAANSELALLREALRGRLAARASWPTRRSW